LPEQSDDYVHRIGRTGRAMRQGLSYTLCTSKDRSKLRFIQNYTKSKIEEAQIPTIEVIKDQQATKLVDQIKEEMETKMPKRYKECLDRLTEEGCNQEQMIEALFKMVMKNQTMSADDRIKLEDMKVTRNQGQVGDHVRLFINLGKKDKLKDVDLIKMITKETSTPRNGVRRVDIMEKFSFFEVPNGCEDEILGVLTKQKYKGRKINIEVAQRKGGSSRKGR
ncbi:MAG: DbpA RNA binding domain-containing protein, partial [Niameybacter sp.]